jgi:hypothetical protein
VGCSESFGINPSAQVGWFARCAWLTVADKHAALSC